MKIDDVHVYDMNESILASGFPKSIALEPTVSTSYLVEKDFKRADKLSSAPIGSGHDCFLKGIVCAFNVTASQNWWLQFGRYKFANIVSSTSKMHTLVEKLATKGNACYDAFVDEAIMKRMGELVEEYINAKDKEEKDSLFLKLAYSCPMGYLLTARVSTNYLQLKTIYAQRKNHKLPEWIKFTKFIGSLPHSDWIYGTKGTTK